MLNQQPRIAIVTRETRLSGMLNRWATVSQAKFLFRSAGRFKKASNDPAAVKLAEAAAEEDFLEIQTEDQTYQAAIHELIKSLDFGLPLQIVQRQYLPTFDFRNCSIVVVVGQDGLVANAAKYAVDIPIVAVNPDPARFDGVLLPFQLPEARGAVQRVLEGKAQIRNVTLARATLHDGQTLLAFNDLFIGVRNHTSARYQIEVRSQREQQSSSGILVCTGAGSTGWMSSVINMARGVSQYFGGQPPNPKNRMKWSDRSLMWAVREPFISRTTQVGLVMGVLSEGEELLIESLIADSGVIFSDGIESDFLEFNAGTIARLTTATESALLVVKK